MQTNRNTAILGRMVGPVPTNSNVTDELNTRINGFYSERGRKPAYLMLGWEPWLGLGLEPSGVREILRVNAYDGIPIIVDEQVPRLVRCLPHPGHARLGAR